MLNEKSKLINRLFSEREYRASYIRAKLDTLIPSQLRALRLRQPMTQPQLAVEADMKQSRISAMEQPGRVNFNLETLVRMAATHKVGLLVEFVPFSEMLEWENNFSQDNFDVVRLDQDRDFLQGRPSRNRRRFKRQRGLSFIGNSQDILGRGNMIATNAQLNLLFPSPEMGQPRQFPAQQTESGNARTKWLNIDRTAEGKGTYGLQQTSNSHDNFAAA